MSVLELERVSRWFGNVVAVNDITMTIGPGITGLLGPNGAGKSTLIHLMAGFLPPSSGSVRLDGEVIWHNEQLYRRIGLVPEREALYDNVTGWQFVLANARLHRLAEPEAAADRAIATAEMEQAAHRALRTYSKGMRQRIKVATALVHDPAVLLLDEPFNGLDPRQRSQLIDLLHAMGDQGRTVLVSSHVLEEVEQLASNIQVLVAGRHAASGDFREIRRLMTERPHRYTVRSSDNRALAAEVLARGLVSGAWLTSRTGSPDALLHLQTSEFSAFAHALPRLARDRDITIRELIPEDESLESVFSYLVAR
jgi:ABC-2 type transport system ATP-binding protein